MKICVIRQYRDQSTLLDADLTVSAEVNVEKVNSDNISLKSVKYKGYPYVVIQWCEPSTLLSTLIFDVLHPVFDDEEVMNDPNLLINKIITDDEIILNYSDDENCRVRYFYQSVSSSSSESAYEYAIATLEILKEYHDLLMRGVLVSNDTTEDGDPDA